MILFISSSEIIFILIAVLLLFGTKRIPEMARAIGKGFREFQKAKDEIKREFRKVEDVGKNDNGIGNTDSSSSSKLDNLQ